MRKQTKKKICINCYYCSESVRISTNLHLDRRVAYCLLDGSNRGLGEDTCTKFQYPIIKELYFRDTKEILPETIQQEADYQQCCDFIENEMEKTND